MTDVASSVGLPRPTAYRLLETLASEGYVESRTTAHLPAYQPGAELGCRFSDRDLAVEVAKPLIKIWPAHSGGQSRWRLRPLPT